MPASTRFLSDEEAEGLGVVAVALAVAAALDREVEHGRDDQHADQDRGGMQHDAGAGRRAAGGVQRRRNDRQAPMTSGMKPADSIWNSRLEGADRAAAEEPEGAGP